MQQSRGGMGSRKHGKSGWKNGSGKSPKLRLYLKMEAEKNERRARRTRMVESIRKLFEH